MKIIINKDGKYYQDSEVIILPTDDKSFIAKHIFANRLCAVQNFPYDDNSKFQNRHIYFTSNEKPIQGEWGMLYATGIKGKGEGHFLFQHKGDKLSKLNCLCSGTRKIIATTDTSLTIQLTDNILQEKGDYIKCLPQPETEFIESFIKSYNEGKVITKALIEVDFIRDSDTGNPNFGGYDVPDKYELKITENNTIIIKN